MEKNGSRQPRRNAAKSQNRETPGVASPETHRLLDELSARIEELKRTNKDLREARELHSDIYDSSPLGYFFINSQNVVVEANLTGHAMLGTDNKHLIGARFTRFISPESSPNFYLHKKKATKSGQTQICELEMVRADGTPFSARVKLSRETEEQLCLTVLDITERRQSQAEASRAKQAHHWADQRLNTVLETMPSGVVIMEKPNGRVAYANSRAIELLKLNPCELELKDHLSGPLKLLKLDGTAYLTEELPSSRALFKGEQVHGEELIIERSDGSRVFVAASTAPLRDADNEIVASVSIIDDITERKLAQQANIEFTTELRKHRDELEKLVTERTRALKTSYTELQESHARLAEAQRIAGLGYWEWDLKNNDVFLSGEIYRDFGLGQERIKASRELFLRQLPHDEVRRLKRIVDGILSERKPRDFEHRMTLPDGSERTVYERTEIVFDKTGNPLRLRGTSQDITELRKTQTELRELSERVLNIEEEEQRRIGQELHDAVGQSVTVLKLVLHEARNSPPERISAALDEADTLVNEIAGQVRDLSHVLQPAMLDDFGLLEALKNYIQQFGSRSAIHVKFKNDGQERRFPVQVETVAFRIVHEALTNAARHAGAREVEVSISADDDILRLEVRDNGAGFDPATISSDSLGLRSMQQRAQLLGGALTIDTAPGVGTCVTAELPLRLP